MRRIFKRIPLRMIKNTCETPPVFYNSSNVCILGMRSCYLLYIYIYIYNMYVFSVATHIRDSTYTYTCTQPNMYVKTGIYVYNTYRHTLLIPICIYVGTVQDLCYRSTHQRSANIGVVNWS